MTTDDYECQNCDTYGPVCPWCWNCDTCCHAAGDCEDEE